jgi:alpha-mannosidase
LTENDFISIENNQIQITFDKNARIIRFWDKVANRDIVEPSSPANVFKYFEDIPLFWDAWDVNAV